MSMLSALRDPEEVPSGFARLRSAFAVDLVLCEEVGARRDVGGKVRAAQLAAIGRFSPAIMAANICNAAVLLIAFARSPLAGVATLWAFAIVAFSLFIYLRSRANRHRPVAQYVSCRGVRRALFNSFVLGAFWGAVPMIFFGGTLTEQVIVVCLAVGMMCAGCFVLAAIPLATMAYLAPLAAGSVVALMRDPAYNLVVVLLLSYMVTLLAASAAHAGQFIARVLAQGEAEHTATLDSLTKLPNRTALLPALEDAVERCRRFGEAFALLSIDLDGFKRVNDRLGHPAGDEMLIRVAERLATGVRARDLVARVGGDEFALIARGVQSPGEAADIADRLIGLFDSSIAVSGESLKVGLSIGVALAPSDGLCAATLLERADNALYETKNAGRNGYRLFQAADDLAVRRRKAWKRDLRNAIARREMHLVFQPVLRLEDGHVSGFEALLRWTHPHLGAIGPADFIPVAETSGLVREIGDFVIDEACRVAATWPPGTRVCVNFSLDQFRSLSVVTTVLAALARHGLAPERFEVEVTESILYDDSAIVLETLHALHAAGLRLVLDDFGTGFSSLRHLQDLPIDGVKIDRSFTQKLPGHPRAEAIVRAVIELCRSLDIRVTGEGIETAEQLAVLHALGCDEAQGFWIGRPETADAALAGSPVASTATMQRLVA